MDTQTETYGVFTGVEVKKPGRGLRLRMVKHRSECYRFDDHIKEWITTQQTGTSQDNVQKRSSKSTSEVSSVSSICDMDTNRTVQAVFTGVEVKPCGKAGRGLRMIKHKSECYSLDKNSSTIGCSK
uniref:Uncharacterized protein n=1 Tax=Oryza barthii TaxID=65489 RepID=A0A0D3F0G7_9ORYZ